MKLWIKRSLAGVSVLAGVGVIGVAMVAGGVATGVFGVVTGSSIFSARYWNSLCVIKPQEYAKNMNELRDKLGLSSVPAGTVRSGPHFVPGPIVQENFEGNPDHPINLINYDIPCKYPPYSIKQGSSVQELDMQPNDLPGKKPDKRPGKLPQYCYEIIPTPTPTPAPAVQASAACPPSAIPTTTPAPTASPGPSPSPSPYYHYGCPTPTPISPPVTGLGRDDLQAALERSSGGGNAPQTLEAVGALKIRLTNSDGNPDLNTDPEFWGTGFVIADNIFATTCHILEPLFEKDKDGNPIDHGGKFVLRGDVRLYVDFTPGYKDDEHPNPVYEFPAQYLDCSHQTGLDVALLLLCSNKNNDPVPTPVTLYSDDLKYLEATPAVLVSYVDLRHPLDEITTEMYQPFVDAPDDGGNKKCKPDYGQRKPGDPKCKYGYYWKFAMVDGVVAARRCMSVDLLLDLADTSVGASGALVLSRFRKFPPGPPDPTGSKPPDTRDIPLVVGLHKCCAAYFGEEKGYDPPPTISCAALHRTPINQDVSTVSILNDDTLRPILKDHNVKVQNNRGECANKFSKCKQ